MVNDKKKEEQQMLQLKISLINIGACLHDNNNRKNTLNANGTWNDIDMTSGCKAR